MDTQTIRINSGTIIRTLFFILLAYLLYLLVDVLLIVLTAVVIASAIEPAIHFLEKHKIPRTIAVIGLYLFGAAGLFTFVYFLIPPIISDLSNLILQAPEYIRSLQLESTFLGEGSLSISQLTSNLQATALESGQDVIRFISSIFGGVVSFFLIIILSFYLAVRQGGIEQFLRLVVPTSREDYVTNLWHRSQKKMGQWLQGQLVLMLIIGVLVYLGLSILGIPNALLLGILAGLFEIIPVFGPILAAVPAIGLAGISGGLSLALMTAGLFIIVQQFENNLIVPLVNTKTVGVPPIIVILAIVIGGSLVGFLGFVLAVPLAAVFMEFAHDVDTVKHGEAKTELSADGAN
jgi:predicted PurR-regulated permease PerM